MLWTDLTSKRLYVTGFTADYDLPNETAYADNRSAGEMLVWLRGG